MVFWFVVWIVLCFFIYYLILLLVFLKLVWKRKILDKKKNNELKKMLVEWFLKKWNYFFNYK